MTRCVAPVLFLLLLALCLVTCQEKVSDGRLTVAFIPKSFTDPFWLDAIAGAERAAAEMGVELLVSSTRDETQVVEQVQIVENMILRGVDGIVLAPSDSDALVAAVLKANEAKVPLSTIDTGVSGGDTVTFAATDNILCAGMAVDRLATRLGGKGKIAAISCTQPVHARRSAAWSRCGHISTAASRPMMSSLATFIARPKESCGALLAQAALTRSLRPISMPVLCGPCSALPPL